MSPENGRARPAENGTGSETNDDQLAGDQVQDITADAHSVVDGAWRQLVGLLLSAPPLPLARELLDGLPPAPDLILDWWISGARLCVHADVVPTPLTVTDANIRAGVEPPPALRGHAVSSGWALVSDAGGTPMAVAGHLVRIIRAGHISRAVEVAGERLIMGAWRGDRDALAELVQREAGAVLALCAAEAT